MDLEIYSCAIFFLFIGLPDSGFCVVVEGPIPKELAIEGALSARIDITNHERPLPSGCEVTQAAIALIRPSGRGYHDVGGCDSRGEKLSCVYLDQRYHGIGQGFPSQLRMVNISTDMAGDYMVTVHCTDSRKYQMNSSVLVQAFPSKPDISITESSGRHVMLECIATSRSEPPSFRRNMTYSWQFDGSDDVTCTQSQHTNRCNITWDGLPVRVICIAKELNSDLESQHFKIVEITNTIPITYITPGELNTVPDNPHYDEHIQLYILTGTLGVVALIALVVTICFAKYMQKKKEEHRQALARRKSSKTTVVTITGTPVVPRSRPHYVTSPRSLSLSVHGDRSVTPHSVKRLSTSLNALVARGYHDYWIGDSDFNDRFSDQRSVSTQRVESPKMATKPVVSVYESIPGQQKQSSSPPFVVYSTFDRSCLKNIPSGAALCEPESCSDFDDEQAPPTPEYKAPSVFENKAPDIPKYKCSPTLVYRTPTTHANKAPVIPKYQISPTLEYRAPPTLEYRAPPTLEYRTPPTLEYEEPSMFLCQASPAPKHKAPPGQHTPSDEWQNFNGPSRL